MLKSSYFNRVHLSKIRPNPFLKHNTNNPTPKNSPSPRIRQLSQARPEAVLLSSPSLQLLILVRVVELVARFLARFVLLVTTDEAQVCVVCEWTKENEGVEAVGGVKDDEGEVDEGVAEVTVRISFCSMKIRSLDEGVPTLDAARYSTHHYGRDQTASDGAIPTAYRQKPP